MKKPHNRERYHDVLRNVTRMTSASTAGNGCLLGETRSRSEVSWPGGSTTDS